MRLFEKEFARLLEEQKRSAAGQRKEMLQRDLSGTYQMLKTVVWPVKKSLEGLTLELEVISRSGVRVYVDAFEHDSRLALESEGYVVHAEKITRDRFDFEKMKVRTIGAYGYFYTPFTRDELEKRPDECRSSYAELRGIHAATRGDAFIELNLFEREVLRYALHLHRTLRIEDVKVCLGLERQTVYKVLKSLVEKQILIPAGDGDKRIHLYDLGEKAYRYRL